MRKLIIVGALALSLAACSTPDQPTAAETASSVYADAETWPKVTSRTTVKGKADPQFPTAPMPSPPAMARMRRASPSSPGTRTGTATGGLRGRAPVIIQDSA
jgi:hypothetical protein